MNRRSLSLFLAFAAPFSFVAPPALAQIADPIEATPGTDERAAELQGTWCRRLVDHPTRPQGADDHYTVDGSLIDWSFADVPSSYRVDSTTTPKRIDLDLVTPRNERFGVQAIYETNGDSLRVRFPEKSGSEMRDGRIVAGPPPASFDGPGETVMEFERTAALPTPRAIFGFEYAYGTVASVDFDGQGLAAIGIGPTLLVYDLERSRILDSTETFAAVVDLDVFPDGTRIAAVLGAHPTEAVLLDFDGLRQIARFPGFEQVLVSPDGTKLVLWAKDKPARVLDAYTYEVLFESRPGRGSTACVAFRPDGELLAVRTYGDATIDLYDVASGERTGSMDLGEDAEEFLTSIAFHPSGDRLAVAEELDGNNRISAWNVAERRRMGAFYGGIYPTCLAFAPDGETLASGDQRPLLELWRADEPKREATWRPVRNTDAGLRSIHSIVYSPDGDYLAATSANVCYLWKLDDSDESETFRWPEWDADARRRELERHASFLQFGFWDAFVEFENRHVKNRPRNYVDDAGNPTISWRVDLPNRYGQSIFKSSMRLKEPWNSDWNRRAISLGAKLCASPGVEEGKTAYLLATGATTAYDGSGLVVPVENPGTTILLLEAKPERAVTWTEPRDFVFDPAEPHAGLPDEGFHVIMWDGFGGYVRPDAPDEVLRMLFSAEEEENELEAFQTWVERGDRRLFRPQPGRE